MALALKEQEDEMKRLALILISGLLITAPALVGCSTSDQNEKTIEATHSISFASIETIGVSKLETSGDSLSPDNDSGYCLMKFEYVLDPDRIGFTPTKIEVSGNEVFLQSNGVQPISGFEAELHDESYCTQAMIDENSLRKPLVIATQTLITDEEAASLLKNGGARADVEKKARLQLASSCVTLYDGDAIGRQYRLTM